MTDVTIELPGLPDWFDTIKARHGELEEELSYIRADLENCRVMLDNIRLHSLPPFKQTITPHSGEVVDYDII